MLDAVVSLYHGRVVSKHASGRMRELDSDLGQDVHA